MRFEKQVTAADLPSRSGEAAGSHGTQLVKKSFTVIRLTGQKRVRAESCLYNRRSFRFFVARIIRGLKNCLRINGEAKMRCWKMAQSTLEYVIILAAIVGGIALAAGTVREKVTQSAVKAAGMLP